jgi:hypothetical protein
MPAKDGYFIDSVRGNDEVAQTFTTWLKIEALQAELAAYEAV